MLKTPDLAMLKEERKKIPGSVRFPGSTPKVNRSQFWAETHPLTKFIHEAVFLAGKPTNQTTSSSHAVILLIILR